MPRHTCIRIFDLLTTSFRSIVVLWVVTNFLNELHEFIEVDPIMDIHPVILIFKVDLVDVHPVVMEFVEIDRRNIVRVHPKPRAPITANLAFIRAWHE